MLQLQTIFDHPQCNENEINRFVNIYENHSPFRLIRNSLSAYILPNNWVTGYFSSAEARDAQFLFSSHSVL
jgi:hypothetical protein